MPKRRSLLISTAIFALAGLCGLAACNTSQGQKMAEIKFDLGKNIVATAEASGVPKFSARDVNGNIAYSVNAIPAEVLARYTRPGYEITWQPLFSFRLTADEKRKNDLQVYRASLSLDSDVFKSSATAEAAHAAAQAFVEQTIAQFQKGKWQRHFQTEADDGWTDIRLTGRSSYLGADGKINVDIAPLDPLYKIPANEWADIAKLNLRYKWVGDNVLATLEVGYSYYPNQTKPTYTMGLEFERFNDKDRVHGKEISAENLKKGDAKGWNSTAKAAVAKAEWEAERKVLEANALKRGDQVLAKP
jgi:hypothetical protein